MKKVNHKMIVKLIKKICKVGIKICVKNAVHAILTFVIFFQL